VVENRVVAPQRVRSQQVGALALRSGVAVYSSRRYLDYSVFDALHCAHQQIREHAAKRSARPG
jgi:glutamine synthetase adenylyltransferase